MGVSNTLPLLLGILYLVYKATQIIYRLYLSPIAHIPGPTLAAASTLYQFYHDVVLRGRYAFHIAQLHQVYGPVIRISPHEIHVLEEDPTAASSPPFVDVLYTSSAAHRRDKWAFYTEVFSVPGSAMNTNPHELHRVRRQALNPFFGKASIRRLQGLIDGKVRKMVERLEELLEGGEERVVRVEHVMAAFTNGMFGSQF